MFLAIEFGGTKLQVAIGSGQGESLTAYGRAEANPRDGAEGIRRQVEQLVRPIIQQHPVHGIGIGFGGPVDSTTGRTIISHQVDGWKDFPLVDWCRETFKLPVALGNDSDMAGLAEARFGAGQGHRIVFYTNVGSGIGGALVIDGEVYPGSRGMASELGHLRPGLECSGPQQTLESVASGWGITAAVQRQVGDTIVTRQAAGGHTSDMDHPTLDVDDLMVRCGGQMKRLTAKTVAEAAVDGNSLARQALDRACRAYGWAIAQMATLLAPGVVVVGGGVALTGEELWFKPLREHVRHYVFPPLAGTFEIVPAKLGEEVVLHGALALAASRLA
jgi:glucokinase